MRKMVEIKTNDISSNEDHSFQVILDMARKGDERAFKQLYDMLAGKMYSLCLRYAGNTYDANDMFQEAFIRVYKSYQGVCGTQVDADDQFFFLYRACCQVDRNFSHDCYNNWQMYRVLGDDMSYD